MKTATTIDPDALYWASFNRFEMRLPGAAALDCSHSGRCDTDVARWAPIVAKQADADAFRNRPTPDKIRAELKECGAWDADELADDEANWRRIVWIAAGNIAEDEAPDCSEPAWPMKTTAQPPPPTTADLLSAYAAKVRRYLPPRAQHNFEAEILACYAAGAPPVGCAILIIQKL